MIGELDIFTSCEPGCIAARADRTLCMWLRQLWKVEINQLDDFRLICGNGTGSGALSS